jgi:hypothetical protein
MSITHVFGGFVALALENAGTKENAAACCAAA